MFPVDKVKLGKSRCLRLWEITSIVDHRPVNCQVIKYFLGDKPGEGVVEDEHVDARCACLELALDVLLVGIASGGGNEYLTLLQRCVLCLLEDHTEGDTLGVRGEDPADGEAGLGHSDGDEAVGTGPNEQLPIALSEVGDLFHCEG